MATITQERGEAYEDDLGPPTVRDMLEALRAEFDEAEIRTRPGRNGETYRYVDAQAVARRLDAVVSPAGWECDCTPYDQGVKCAITIHLPDGSKRTRAAMGGYPEKLSGEDTVKGGDTDAFRRAAMRWGVGAYLYRGGSEEPLRRHDRGPDRRPTNGNGHGDRRDYIERPQRADVTGQRNGAQRERAARGEPDDGRRDGGTPRNGKQLYALLKEWEETRREAAGVLEYIMNFGDGQRYPKRMLEWDFDQARTAHAEALDFMAAPFDEGDDEPVDAPRRAR